MEHKLNIIKADLYNVFVQGNADNSQQSRVFVMIALPVMSIFYVGSAVTHGGIDCQNKLALIAGLLVIDLY